MRILIVDDEELARETLTSMIMEIYNDGIVHDVEILQAKDGEEAYSIIQENQPEVIIADIMMPKLNGIELLTHINQSELNTIFIFVSGFNSFEYAQKAISLGAFSYILKPVHKNELEENLIKSQIKLEKEKEIRNSNLIHDLMLQKNVENLQKSFIKKLVTNKILKESLPKASLAQKLTEINIHFKYNYFTVILMSIINNSEENNYSDVEYGIKGVIKETFNKNNLDCYEFDYKNKLGFVLNCMDDKNIKETISYCCSTIIQYMNDFYKFYIAIGIGSFTNSEYDLNTSYHNANCALFQILFEHQASESLQNNLGFYEVNESKETILEDEFSVYEKNIEHQLEACSISNDKNSVLQTIRKYYRVFFSNPLEFSYDAISKLNFRTIMTMAAFLKKSGVEPDSVLGDEFLLYNNLNSCKNMEEIILWCSEKFTIILDVLAQKNNNLKIVNHVKDFVRSNIDRDISLVLAADNVFLTPQYLSKIFHQIEGDSFVSYVKKVKIEKAKQLLKQGCKPGYVSKIIGYNDTKYFFKVFKQATGVSPSVYKKLKT